MIPVFLEWLTPCGCVFFICTMRFNITLLLFLSFMWGEAQEIRKASEFDFGYNIGG